MSNLYRLLQYLRPYLPRMTGAVMAMFVVAGATAASASLVKAIFDEGLQAGVTPEQLLRLAGLWILVFLVLGIARFASSYLMAAIGYAVVRDIRVDVYRHLQYVPLGFVARRSTGGLMSRVTSDVLAIQEAVTRVLVDVLREGLVLVGLLLWMFSVDWVLALATMTLAPVVVALISRMGRRLRRVSRQAQQGLGEISSLLQETLTGLRIVKAFCMEKVEVEKFRRAAERLYRHTLRGQRLDSLGSPLMELIGAILVAALLVYGSWQISAGDLTLGDFTSFLYAAFFTYAPLRRLSSANARIQMAAAAADRLFEILDTPVEPGYAHLRTASVGIGAVEGERLEGRPMPALVEAIDFDKVSFAYDDHDGVQQEVLDRVDFEIPSGRAVALVGASGSGKTTVANLIPRFYDPTGGAVRIDGTDLRDIRLGDLRAHIAMVTQDTILFNDTVRSNIAYGNADVSDEAVREAARAAFAHNFVVQLPEGYDTVLGERGLRLSGGQRQRIAIARALVKNAPILILDEATSNLDERSEQLVQEALANLMEGRTTLIIAHRLSTVRRADLIVVLEAGRVVESGTHEELLASMGSYQRLYSMQLASAQHGYSVEQP